MYLSNSRLVKKN